MTADIARLRADAQYLNETGCRMVATWNIVNAANDHQQLTQEVERLQAGYQSALQQIREACDDVDRLRDIIKLACLKATTVGATVEDVVFVLGQAVDEVDQ